MPLSKALVDSACVSYPLDRHGCSVFWGGGMTVQSRRGEKLGKHPSCFGMVAETEAVTPKTGSRSMALASMALASMAP